MNVICFGQQAWDHCWTGKQQLLTRLARRGHRVLYVDPDWDFEPRAFAAQWRARLATRPQGLREVGPGSLWVYTHPFLPWLGWRLNVRRHAAVLERLVTRLCLEDALAVVMRPDHPERIAAVRPAARVYFAVDEWTAFPGYRPEERRALRAAEEARLAECDLALGVSPRLVRRFRELQPDARLLHNGADVEHFAPARLARAPLDPALAELAPPRIGFVGQIDERIDEALVAEIAAARPDWSLVFVGRRRPGADLARLERAPNVHLPGYRPYAALPGVLAGFDACAIPYVESELTHSCSPLKAYEFLATGKPVVATPLEGLAPLGGLVASARGRDAWIAALERALADPGRGAVERVAAARGHSWEVRADELEGHLADALERAGRRGPRAVPGARLARLEDPPERFNDYGNRLAAHRPSPLLRLAFGALRGLGWLRYGGRLAARALAGRPARIRSILVVRNAWLGDTLTLLPALRALRASFPDARIVLGVQRGMRGAELLEEALKVEVRELELPRDAGRLARARAALALFLEGFDAVVSGQEYFLRPEAFLAGAPHRIGPYDGHPLQRWNGRALLADRNRHDADTGVALAELLAGRPAAPRPAPDLLPHPGRLAAAGERARARLGLVLAPGERWVVLHPGAAKPSRRWPAERFGALADRLLARRGDLRVVLTGVERERELGARVRAAVAPERAGRVVDAIGATDLDELAALLYGAALVVTNDTGGMHLARALGAPLLALFGPENERRWGPHPDGRAPAVVLRHVVPCAPCARVECPAHWCMGTLGVDAVLARALALLAPPRAERALARTGAEHAECGVRVHRAHEDWQSLADAGYALPRLTVLVPDAAAARALAGQSYPAIEPVVVERAELAPSNGAHHAGTPADPLRARVLHGDVVRAWREVLARTSGELVAVTGSDPWSLDRAAAHVADLCRHPEAELAWTRARAGGATVRGRPSADLTVRRAALERALATASTAALGAVPFDDAVPERALASALRRLVADLPGIPAEASGPRGVPPAPPPRPRPRTEHRVEPPPVAVGAGGRP